MTADVSAIEAIINAATAYKGAIPDDCWHEPYMGHSELLAEIASHSKQFALFQIREAEKITFADRMAVLRVLTMFGYHPHCEPITVCFDCLRASRTTRKKPKIR